MATISHCGIRFMAYTPAYCLLGEFG